MRSTAKVDIMNQVLAETPQIGALYLPLMITLNWFEAHCAILLSVWYPGLDVMANADDSSAVVCLFSRDTKCATGRVRSRCGSKLFWTPKMGTGQRVKTIKSQHFYSQ